MDADMINQQVVKLWQHKMITRVCTFVFDQQSNKQAIKNLVRVYNRSVWNTSNIVDAWKAVHYSSVNDLVIFTDLLIGNMQRKEGM